MNTKELMEYVRQANGVVAPKDLFLQVPIEFIRNSQYTPNEKTLFLLLWTYGIGSKTVYPSQSRLAKQMGTTTKTIRSILQKLEEKEGVYIVQQYIEGTNEKTSNLYFLSEITKDGEFKKGYFDMVKIRFSEKKHIIQKATKQPRQLT
ncbi:hypothetical protein CBE01nite_41210 [Clostridium beijerinckii]|uniref:Helix-turn-helix domain-containing protein n=1 Tax=Clostridium beijerinckii TaxID=1520 RepID=A0AB74VEZ8_CLOBE|nr:helix-turn-helix domain-containing protein [Clostridium beijerinckii]NRZ29418.1 DNA-binding MarR family transcriptional regulator [Clostridium beijerinckii]NYB94812.1 DNA-binding MarR family transcriptional regulator [Clostridium beijerinckii]OOM28048.1 hypothetical protein CLBEI_00240 [Clostridium beijerinckii]QUN35051.1 helix-turn-helix domain-containing protein [Clostridium beijerinckii]SQA99960.1 Uncharacterised protein [Clostridium beijerinckii]